MRVARRLRIANVDATPDSPLDARVVDASDAIDAPLQIGLQLEPEVSWQGQSPLTLGAVGNRMCFLTRAGGSFNASDEVKVYTGGNNGPFKQDAGTNGIISVDVEHFHGNVAQGGHAWSADGTAGASGSALRSTPNTGRNNNTGYTTNSPRLDFRVNFVKTGTHHVWIRGIGANGNDDSIHAGLDGVASTSSDRMSSSGTTWTWSKSTMDGVSATISVPSTGVHTINLWMREDGFVVDKLVLTTSSSYVPSGTGPAESPR